MDSPQPASSTDIESPGSSTSQYSPAPIDPTIMEQLSEPQKARVRRLVDAMGRCVQGHDYTKEEFLAYSDMEDFDAVLGIQENVKPQSEEDKRKLQEKKDWKKKLVHGIAVLKATLTSEVSPDHQVPDEELDAVLHLLCRVARAMFLGFDNKLGYDNKAREDWRKAICRAADHNGKYGNHLDVIWPEYHGPEGWIDLT